MQDQTSAPTSAAFPAPARNPREVLLFGLTPPRAETTPERVAEIAARTLARVEALPIDALVIYDITDEADRNPQPRPFPFVEMLDPATYLGEGLAGWDKPAVIYRCVGKYDPDELRDWLRSAPDNVMTVFVGSSSSDAPALTSLPQAVEIHHEARPELPRGAVTIPERHIGRGDEHQRLLRKQQGGSRFFITQIVYDIGAAKNLASDYHYAALERGVDVAPIVFTLSLCGSAKTLSFLEWLGVEVPHWVRNEILHCADPLDWSRHQALNAARELAGFCRYLGIPFGFNVESVSSRKVEIEAAVALTHEIAELLERG